MSAFNVLAVFAMVVLSGVAAAEPVAKGGVSTSGKLLFDQRFATGNIGSADDSPDDLYELYDLSTTKGIGGYIKGKDFYREVIGGGSFHLPATDITLLDDYADDISTTGELVVGGDVVAGNIGSVGDRDWFAVNLQEGRPYRIEMQGHENGDGELVRPFLWGIHDASGRHISDMSGSFTDEHSHVRYTPASSGVRYISAGSRGGVGGYRLSVMEK